MEEYKTKRVRYKKSPLIEVIFQLRFPTILSINANVPVDFQERIRAIFPIFQEQVQKQQQFTISPELQSAQMRDIGESKIYTFITADGTYKIDLSSSFISISTRNYIQWESFKEYINMVIPIFEEIYKPAFYNRIGFRLVNVFVKSSLGLLERKWSDLVNPNIIGMMGLENEDNIHAYSSNIEYRTKEEDVRSRTHVELVNVDNKQELSLLIDCDYFNTDIIQLNSMYNIAEKLHNASSSFISKAITEELYNAMEPEEIM